MGTFPEFNPPGASSRFMVQIGAVPVAAFAEVSGLSATVQVLEVKEGGSNGASLQLPGRVTWTNLSMKKGRARGSVLWEWFLDVSRGKIVRYDVTIMLVSTLGIPKAIWNFSNAYPVKWTGPTMDANSSDKAFDVIELAHEGYMHTIDPRG